MFKVEEKPAGLDYAAIGMSFVCALHCTALPFIVAALPWLGSGGHAEAWFHVAMLAIAIPVSVYALGRAWRRCRQPLPAVLGGIGLALMVVATFEFMAWHTLAREQFLTLLGAGILSAAHVLNLRNFFRPRQVRSMELPEAGV